MSRLRLWGRHREEADAAAVEAVAANIDNVNAVATNEANINAVATNMQDITDNAANVAEVASNIDNVNAVAGNETNIDAVAAGLADVATLAESMAYSKSQLRFVAPEIRSDTDVTKRGAILVLNGVTVYGMAHNHIAHMGDGYMPIKSLTQHDIKLTAHMSSPEAGKNIQIITKFFDQQNVLLKKLVTDDIPTPIDTNEFTLILPNALEDTMVPADIEGRIEVKYLTAATNPHLGSLLLKKVEVLHV